MRQTLLYISMAAMAFWFADPTTCIASVVQWSGNGHWYEAVLEPGLTWEEARAAAEARTGYLATITSPEENTFLYALIDSDEYWVQLFGNFVDGPWLGGYQPAAPNEPNEPAGGWEWITGEEFEYQNWSGDGPNDLGGLQHVLHFHGLGERSDQWDDLRSNARYIHGYMVEYDNEPIPEPATLLIWSLLALLGAGVARARTNERS